MDRVEIESVLGEPVAGIAPLSGGQVAATYLVTLKSGAKVVVKSDSNAPLGIFDCEADGLAAIRKTGAIRVPEVLAVRDGAGTAPENRMIVLEYIRPDHGYPVGSGALLGEALARMHSASPSPTAKYGYARGDNFLGRAAQANAWRSDWPSFYRDMRLLPQLERAAPILGAGARRVETLIDSCDSLLAGMSHDPVLIHGDLWSGNLIVSGGLPVLIDPAVYYGHPEIEWAYIELFGGFPAGMRAAYDRVRPRSHGYEARRPVLQLYHLLVHVAHFGEEYAAPVLRVCDAYGF